MKDELDAEVNQKFEKLTEGKGGYCHMMKLQTEKMMMSIRTMKNSIFMF
jgi:hypothetical protein